MTAAADSLRCGWSARVAGRGRACVSRGQRL